MHEEHWASAGPAWPQHTVALHDDPIHVDQPASAGAVRYLAAILLAMAAGLHVAAMFPAYPGEPNGITGILGAPDQTAMYICLEAGWVLAALLVMSRLSVRAGAALGLSLGLVELGLLFCDSANGLAVSNDSAPGIWVAWAGLGAGLAGSCLAASSAPMLERGQGLVRPSWALGAVLTALVAMVAVAAFWAPWDSIHLVGTAGGVSNYTQGNAFRQAPAVVGGNVETGLAIGLAGMAGAAWCPVSVGAGAIAGTVIGLTSQLVSGIVQVHERFALVMGSGHPGLNYVASDVRLTVWWGLDLAATFCLLCLGIWSVVDSRRPPRATLQRR